LSEKPLAGAEIDVLDAAGAVVRTFRSPAVPAEKGVNRFEWDLRYPDARGLPGRTYLMGGSLRGPVAVPGSYRARLRVGEQAWTTPSFEVRMDPRSKATAEELQEQFDLLLRIRDRLSEVHDAVASAENVKRDLERLERRGQESPAHADVGQRAKEIRGKLQEVLDALYEPRFIGIDDQLLLFPIKLNARLASLGGVVASAEGKPTEGAREVFRDLSTQIDAQLEKLRTIEEADVPALNGLAQEKGVDLVFPMLGFDSSPRGSSQ
jgi:hypothetical protein